MCLRPETGKGIPAFINKPERHGTTAVFSQNEGED